METIEIHPDQRFIDGLLHNDTNTIKEIYKRFSGKVKSYILKNSGSNDDAADIFQEILTDIYQQAKYKNLRIACPFEPFLLLLCKKRWLTTLKKRSGTNSNVGLLMNVSEDVRSKTKQSERVKKESKIYLSSLKEMPERCREIITSLISIESQEKLAEKLRISYPYFRKKKAECLAAFIKIIKGEATREIHD